MNQQSYYSKYLKYKKKYLDLKKLIGGDDNEEPSGPKKSEILLEDNLGLKLYMEGFESIVEQKFCEIKNSQDLEDQKLIIDFNNKDISFAPSNIFEEYKNLNDNDSKTFGELFEENKRLIEEYCKLYDEETRPDNIDDGSFVTGLDTKNASEDIMKSIAEEKKDNEVTNLFS